MSSKNFVGKGKIICYEQFLLFLQNYPPVWRTFCHFHQIQNGCLQTLSVWKSLKFVVWEKIKLVQFLGILYKEKRVKICPTKLIVYGTKTYQSGEQSRKN